MPARAERLGGIAHKLQIVFGAERFEAFIVGAAAVDVDRHDGLGARPDGCCRLFWIESEAVRFDIDELDLGAGEAHGVGRSDESEVRNDHLVAGADADCHQPERDRRGAAAHRYCMLHTKPLRDRRFETTRRRPIVDIIACDYTRDSPLFGLADIRAEPSNLYLLHSISLDGDLTASFYLFVSVRAKGSLQ